MLRQKYEQLLDLALTAQNLFDDVASFLERLQVGGWRLGDGAKELDPCIPATVYVSTPLGNAHCQKHGRTCSTRPLPVCSTLQQQAILSWRDRTASALFIVVCILAVVLLQLLGLSTVLCVGLMWQIRPPFLRDPIPPPPLNYYSRLPCLSDELV